jgi:hypothetical protein
VWLVFGRFQLRIRIDWNERTALRTPSLVLAGVDSCSPSLLRTHNLVAVFRNLFLLLFLLSAATSAFAQGGPPYYTNDPGTPGNLNWEINVGYMPFFYSGQSVSHTPDLDINFGVGERVQLTYETAWLRVQNPGSATKFGMNQSNPGVKWRFYDAGEDGLSISIFPQFFLNNPNDAVRRGITPQNDSFLLPVEFSKKFGPVGVDFEVGYQFVHKGPDGWLTGLVLGHDFTPKFEALTSPPKASPRSVLALATKSINRSSFSSWLAAVLNPHAAISPISLAISAFSSCYPPSPTKSNSLLAAFYLARRICFLLPMECTFGLLFGKGWNHSSN